MLTATRERVRTASPLVAATGLSTVGVALSGLTRFGTSALVGHLAGPAALAAVNSAVSLAVLATLVGPNAAGSAAAKFLAGALGAGDEALARATWAHLARLTAAVAGVLAAAAAVAAHLVLHRSAGASLGVGVLVLALTACTVARGAQFGTGGFARAAVAEAVAAVVALGLLGVVLSAGARSLVLAPLALGYAAYAALAWPRRVGARPDVVAQRAVPALDVSQRSEVRSFLGWAVLGSVASAGLLQLSVVVAAAADTPVRAGLYAAAISVGTPMALLAVPLSQALFSLLARARGGGDDAVVRRSTDVATRGLVVVMVAVGGGLALVARTALAVVGPGFGAAVPLLQAVAVTVVVSTLTMPAVASLTSGSGMRLVALMSGSGMLVGLAVMAVAVPQRGFGLGVDGVAAGYVAGTVVVNVLPWCVAWRRHALPWRGLTARVLAGLALLVALLQLPAARSVGGGWALGVAFVAAWALLCTPDLRRLGARAAVSRTAPGPRPGEGDEQAGAVPT